DNEPDRGDFSPHEIAPDVPAVHVTNEFAVAPDSLPSIAPNLPATRAVTTPRPPRSASDVVLDASLQGNSPVTRPLSPDEHAAQMDQQFGRFGAIQQHQQDIQFQHALNPNEPAQPPALPQTPAHTSYPPDVQRALDQINSRQDLTPDQKRQMIAQAQDVSQRPYQPPRMETTNPVLRRAENIVLPAERTFADVVGNIAPGAAAKVQETYLPPQPKSTEDYIEQGMGSMVPYLLPGMPKAAPVAMGVL